MVYEFSCELFFKYSTFDTIMVSLKNKETNMHKKLLNLLKRKYGFYLSLVFFIFPIAYILDGSYPKYVLFLTILAITSYIGMLYTKNKILIFLEWFYLIAYISYTTIVFYPMNILFSFYLSNLLVWHFQDKYYTYRTISFFITINCLTLYIIANPTLNIGDKIVLFIFSSMCIITYFSQKYSYERHKLKHRSINEELKVISDIMTMADISLDIKTNMTTSPSQLVEWTITMILKELTNNVIKHSNANKCNIEINESNNNYTVIISDNGNGFENINGTELSSIRERIKLVNGVINIISKKSPTTIEVTINK